VEFFVIAIFYETKIPTVDMKVQVPLILTKINLEKMKSSSSMRNGRFHILKYRGKLGKMEVLYTPTPLQDAQALA
jgi:hypothetical protein